MSSGFSYPKPIFQSPIYNPAFYLTLDASGYLTYEYAQTLYLNKYDYRLTYITGITPGTATQGIALVPGTNNDISGIGALSCNSLSVGGQAITAASNIFQIPAGTLSNFDKTCSNYNIIIRNQSNSNYTYSGLCFLNDTADPSSTTPSAAIVATKTSDFQYDGADIEFWTKASALGQMDTLNKRGSFSQDGGFNVGPNQGSSDLNIIKPSGSASIRIGASQTTKNCFTLTWTNVGYSNDQNRISFNTFGTSNVLCMTANDRVCIGGSGPTSRFRVIGDSSNLYGSWLRVSEFWNDYGTPMKCGLIMYNEAGGTDSNGVCFGTYTSDPLSWMINGGTCMKLNTSKRLSVDKSAGAEATIHSGGQIWADSCFHSKQNVDGKAVYRSSWSQANYLAMGTDATVGAMRLGTCDASFNWVSYAPVRGGAYTNASDRRIKRDITDIPYGLTEVLRMQPRKFAMRNDGSEHVGSIAQEMLEIIPEVVSIGVNDELNDQGEPINPMGIDLASLVSVLSKAIQELKAEVDELRAIISE